MGLPTTKGTITPLFPASFDDISAQTETNDPVSEDPDFAEGRDANLWSALLETMMRILGLSGRGFVTGIALTGVTPTIDIEGFSYPSGGLIKTFAGATGVALTDGVDQIIFLDLATDAIVVATGSLIFPPLGSGTRFIPLATWFDSTTAAVLTDARTHLSDMPGLASMLAAFNKTLGSDIELTSGDKLSGETPVAAGPGGDALVSGGDAVGGAPEPGGNTIMTGGLPAAGGPAGTVQALHPDPAIRGGIATETFFEVLTGSGASLVTSGLVPPGSLLLGVSVFVVAGDGGGGGATGMDVGDGSDVDRFGAAIVLGPTATTDYSDHTGAAGDLPELLTSGGLDVTLTALGGTFDAISVRVSATFMKLVPAIG